MYVVFETAQLVSVPESSAVVSLDTHESSVVVVAGWLWKSTALSIDRQLTKFLVMFARLDALQPSDPLSNAKQLVKVLVEAVATYCSKNPWLALSLKIQLSAVKVSIIDDAPI